MHERILNFFYAWLLLLQLAFVYFSEAYLIFISINTMCLNVKYLGIVYSYVMNLGPVFNCELNLGPVFSCELTVGPVFNCGMNLGPVF
jgi:hypothetical protein